MSVQTLHILFSVTVLESHRSFVVNEERLKLCVAEKLIEEGNESLSVLLKNEGRLDKSSVMKSQIVINAGIARAKEINSTIERLKEKLKRHAVCASSTTSEMAVGVQISI